MQPLVIYHGPSCKDGWCAAYVAHLHFQSKGIEAELHMGVYGQPPPDVTGREVYIVDFSYSRDVLEAMHAVAKSLVVLDHHKTAQAELEGLPYAIFDMNRSGAGMSWDYFFPGEPRPLMVSYTEDYDLWRHQLPCTKEVNLALYSYPLTIEAWDEITNTSLEEAVTMGEAMLLLKEGFVRDQMGTAYEVREDFEDREVRYWKVNSPKWGISDLLASLCETPFSDGTLPDFSMAWSEDQDQNLQFGLRSRVKPGETEAFDVSEYAKARGGGGHAQAAGFRVAKENNPLAYDAEQDDITLTPDQSLALFGE